MKERTRFVDRFGNEVQLGDRLQGDRTHFHLEGIVVALNPERDSKPFTVNVDGELKYFNSEFCEKVREDKVREDDDNYQVMAIVRNTGARESWSHPVLTRAQAVKLMRAFEKVNPHHKFFIIKR